MTPVLEAIDALDHRDQLVEALLRGLLTTANAAVLLAPRKGQFIAVDGAGEIDGSRLRSRPIPIVGAVAESIARGERIGHLDALGDADLMDVLDLRHVGAIDVLMHVAPVGDRPALILISFGIGELTEASRRARALSAAASQALARLLGRPSLSPPR